MAEWLRRQSQELLEKSSWVRAPLRPSGLFYLLFASVSIYSAQIYHTQNHPLETLPELLLEYKDNTI